MNPASGLAQNANPALFAGRGAGGSYSRAATHAPKAGSAMGCDAPASAIAPGLDNSVRQRAPDRPAACAPSVMVCGRGDMFSDTRIVSPCAPTRAYVSTLTLL